jgi:hypothetical protein
VRIAFITILICGSLIFWHWKAGLISNLSVVKYEPPFNSLEELLSSNFKVCFLTISQIYRLGKFTMVSKPLRFLAVKAAQDAHYYLSIYI